MLSGLLRSLGFCMRRCHYCVCLLQAWRTPRVRLLVKVHKPILDSRLVTSGTKWLTNPLSLVLAVELQKIIKLAPSVAGDTQAVIDVLGSIPSVEKDVHLATYDVDNLYPCLDHDLVKGNTRSELWRHFPINLRHAWGAFVELLCMFLNIVLSAQLASFRFGASRLTKLYIQIRGITTGLSCGTQIANCVLIHLDRSILQAVGQHLLCYQRFVDDILIAASVVSALDHVERLLNSFHDCIKVSRDKDDSPIHLHFLDLDVDASGGILDLKTYRKPMCTYPYTPSDSNHSPSVKRAIIVGEVIRLLRTNNTYKSFAR